MSPALAPPTRVRARWERLAVDGAVSLSWVDDPARAFLRRDGAAASCPWSLASCARVAAHFATMLAAEELGRALLRALAPWRWPQPTTVAWRTAAATRRRVSLGASLGPTSSSAVNAHALAVLPASSASRAAPGVLRALHERVRRMAPAHASAVDRASLAWREAARLRLVPAIEPRGLDGAAITFADLADPFALVAALHAHAVSVTAIDEARLVLSLEYAAPGRAGHR